MLKVLGLFIGIAYAQTAPSYLIYPSQAACLTRSQQMCEAMKCDGVHTIYWWDCNTGPLNAGTIGTLTVTAGSYAMRIDIGTKFYGLTATNSVSSGTQGLSASERSSLVSATSITSILPLTAVTP